MHAQAPRACALCLGETTSCFHCSFFVLIFRLRQSSMLLDRTCCACCDPAEAHACLLSALACLHVCSLSRVSQNPSSLFPQGIAAALAAAKKLIEAEVKREKATYAKMFR